MQAGFYVSHLETTILKLSHVGLPWYLKLLQQSFFGSKHRAVCMIIDIY